MPNLQQDSPGFLPTGISRRAAILVAVLAFGVLVALSEGLHAQIVAGLALAYPFFARQPVVGAMVFVGLSALSAMLVFFSGVILVPVGVQVWGKMGCFLLLWLGWFLGGIITYSIGRFLGRPIVGRLLPRGGLARYEGMIPRSGTFLTVLLVQLTLPSDVSGYFFGLLGYRARVYLGALACAELPYALGAVYLGVAFINRSFGLLSFAAAVALVVVGWGWRRRHSQGVPGERPPHGDAPGQGPT